MLPADPQRYDAQANIGPGHPLYERIRAEIEEEQRRIANLLNDTARELANLGASAACQKALQTHVIDAYT